MESSGSIGVSDLEELRKMLLELNDHKTKSIELAAQEKEFEKELKLRQKQVSDETASVVKARKAELETAYDERMESVKGQLRKVKAKKDKQKSGKVEERIERETKEMVARRKQCADDIRTIYRDNKLPRFLNNRYFQALCQPIGVVDLFLIFLTLIILLVVIPYGIWCIKPSIWVTIVSYVIIVVLFGTLYLVLRRKTKEKLPDEFNKVKSIRKDDMKAKKEIRTIKKEIRKDRDESTYGLEDVNKELEKLTSELEKIVEDKKNALQKFENETKKTISEEISSGYEQEISELKNKQEVAYRKQNNAENRTRTLSIKITEQYNAYLGKDCMDVEVLDRLISMMKSGEAKNFSEALNKYRTENGNAQ